MTAYIYIRGREDNVSSLTVEDKTPVFDANKIVCRFLSPPSIPYTIGSLPLRGCYQTSLKSTLLL